ncbi:NUDIX hydrolase [Egbenema bharatensis]|uniref:NUDIX hydrolase n=1 Tax=Egbenema bharatensis TaxID=3463334 RepID=UPI003A85B8A9
MSQWLKWAQQLQAIAQNGLTFTENPFDVERYQQVQRIAADMLAELTEAEPSKILDLFQREAGYATPKVDARAAVFQDDRILLVRETVLDAGRWTLPGGWIDVGESPSQAVEREVLEETGYQTRALKLIALYDRSHPRHGHPPSLHHTYKMFFLCELLGGTPTDSYETGEASFFARDEIPELSLVRVVPSQVDRMFEHYYHPEWNADFD